MCKLILLGLFTICILSGVSSGREETTEDAKEKLIPNALVDKHVLKRYDQEYQTCLENFDIHKDKIIRTQDSREMGAKYLNEFDLASRDECLRACCGTETCDVFVFEEKSPGSCYLFHCGPPDDFKCKFTKHHNYTSAVLASNRHLNELENQIKLTKHEQELTQLRKSDVAAQSTGTPYISTTIVAPEPPKELVQVASTSTKNTTSERHCSMYQFECRRSGECIAIYNACDGIPQCADGSDEAPELDCPTQGTTQPSPPPPPPRPSTPSLLVGKLAPIAEPPLQRDKAIQEQTQHAPITPPEELLSQPAPDYNSGSHVFSQQQLRPQGWHQPPPHPQQPQPPMMSQYPAGQQREGAGSREKGEMFPLGANLPLPAKNYGVEGEGQPNYMPWNNYQHQGQYPPTGISGRQYQDGTSHIFRGLGKGIGLVPDSDSPAGQYDNRNDYNSKYPGSDAYYNNAPYRPPVSPNMWPPTHQQPAHDGNSMPILGEMPRADPERKMPLPPDYYNYEDSQATGGQDGRFHGQGSRDHHDHNHDHDSSLHQEARPYPYHGSQKNSEEASSNPVQMQPQPKLMLEPSLEAKLQEDLHRNKGTEHVHVNPEKTTVTSTESAPKSGGSVKKVVKPEEARSKDRLSEETVIIEEVDMGGSGGRPTGAILSLALGLCITGILVTMVGCRVRVIKKRLRRGSKTYAHDADYLVNGMYL